MGMKMSGLDWIDIARLYGKEISIAGFWAKGKLYSDLDFENRCAMDEANVYLSIPF